MALPKEPRQAMINMMYLVLTALLAINVSAEVLNAFSLVEHSMTRTNRAISRNLGIVYQAFADRASNDPSSAELWEKARKVREIADSAYQEIEDMKIDFLTTSKVPFRENPNGGLFDTYYSDEDSTLFVDEGSARNTHATTAYFDPAPGTGEHHGDMLREIMTRVKDTLLSTYFFGTDASDTAKMNRLIASSPLTTMEGKAYKDAKGEVDVTWAFKYFHEVPMAGALAILSNIQNNIRTAEADVIDHLKTKVGLESINFDQLRGQVIASKGYYQQGESVEADIFVAASSSSQRPVVWLGSLKPICKKDGKIRNEIKGEEVGNVPPVNAPKKLEPEEGMSSALFKSVAGSIGDQNIQGVIEIKSDKTGKITYHPFDYTYTVGKSNLVVSPANLAVVYAGIPNPMDVAVSGFPSDKLTVSSNNGRIVRDKGSRWNLTPVYTRNAENKCVITVKVDDPGVPGALRSQEFDVKPLPRGTVKISGYESRGINNAQAAQIAGSGGILTADPQGFLFSVKYRVEKWTFYPTINGQTQAPISGNGDRLTAPALDLIKTARKGAIFNIDVTYRSPDGSVKTEPVILTKTR